MVPADRAPLPAGGVSADPQRGVPRRLIGFMNAYVAGMSGGDASFIEIARRLDAWDRIVITSALGQRTVERHGLQAVHWTTSHERRFTHPYWTYWTYVTRTIRAMALLRKLRPGDLMYSTSDFFPDTLPAFLARVFIPQTRWVQRMHHLIPKRRLLQYLAQRISLALIQRRCDLVVVNSNLLCDQLTARGLRRDRIRVNYPGIDLEDYASVPRAEPPNLDAVFLGRLHPAKGVLDFASIWSRVVRQRGTARLGIVGHGMPQIVRDLQALLHKAGLDRSVELLGFLDDAEARRAVAGSRLFISPSYEEGFGMAVLEALALGTPAVVWDLPAYREVFPRGIVRVPEGDEAAFATAIVRLLSDDDSRRALAQDGRDVAQTYSWNLTAQREAMYLEEATGGTPGEPSPHN